MPDFISPRLLKEGCHILGHPDSMQRNKSSIICKTFDRVWQKGLLYKLHCMGCSNRIVKWFESYLSERRQRFVINGQSSDWVHTFADVPQGIIFSPLLFLFTLMI